MLNHYALVEHLVVCNSVRDLGVIVNDSLTPSNHIAKITAIGHQHVNILLRSFTSRDAAMLVIAFVGNLYFTTKW